MTRIKVITRSPLFFILVSTLFIFLVYLFSLCPTLYLIDSGELATVSYTLGVAHPTGYPLYTMISYFISRLPGSPIFNLNLLSALFSTIAAFILLIFFAADQKRDSLGINEYVLWLMPVFLFAFAPTVWRTSVTNEVYPLTGLFCVLVFYLLWRLRSDRDLYLLAYVAGLAFTNHMIVFTLAMPAIIYAIIVHRLPWRKIFISAVFFAVGLTLYLYLLYRTRGGADVAWGNAFNLERLVWHITGKQYRVWMFSSNPTEIAGNLGRGLAILGRDLLYVFVIPVLAGFWSLFKKTRRVGWLLLAIIVLNILYAVNYSIPDIESYYLPAFIALVFAASHGLKSLQRYLRWPIALAICLVIPVVNYRSCTLRGVTFGRDYGLAHIEQLPSRALLISMYWDIYSPIMYLTEVEGLRPDLVVIDKELLRRTWYLKRLEHAYPEFMARVRPQADQYLKELVKFEYGEPYEGAAIQRAYIDLLTGFVDAKMNEGAYLALPYPDPDLDQVRREYRRLPFGPDIQFSPDDSLRMAFDFSRLRLAQPQVMNDTRLDINLKAFRNMIRNNVAYLRAMKKETAAQAAEEWLKKN